MSLISILCVMNLFANSVVLSATVDDAYALHTALFSTYKKSIRPAYDQDSPITVGIVMFIQSIQEFDEVNGKYSFGAGMRISWQDVKLAWNTTDHNGMFQMTVLYDEIWVPELLLSSPSNKVTGLGKSTDVMRIFYDGVVEWFPAALIESTCSINVKNYPFDSQTCQTTFVSLGYKNTEVVLRALSSKISTEVYTPNALWELTDTDVKTISLGSGGESEIIFTFYLKRKSALGVITIIMPILLLSIVSTFVFLLVPESGERIGYCITTLLAIAVYMTIITDTLPKTSEPIPLISYKLFVDLLISVLIVLITIVNLRFYHRDDDRSVPNWLKTVFRRLSCYTCRITKIKPTPREPGPQSARKQNGYMKRKPSANRLDVNEIHVHDDDESPITWKKISYMFDWTALITFTTFNLINIIVFLGLANT